MSGFDGLLERDLIPYEAARFEAKNALVLAPHPDDETFGCGAAIASLRAVGAEVTVLVVSDGAGEEEDPETRRRVTAVRMDETRRALDALGGGKVSNAGLPDRGLARSPAALEAALQAALAPAPDLVFVPSPVEVHPDHRAVAEAFHRVARRRGRRRPAASVAFFELSQPIRPNFLLDATELMERKERAMEAFASQNAGRAYPLYVRGLNLYRTMTLPSGVTAAEGFFVLPETKLARLSPDALRRVLGPSSPPASLERRGLLSGIRRR